MLEITTQQKMHLRGLANQLKPIVTIGQKGFGDEMMELIDTELDNHELLKIKFQDLKEEKKEIVAKICEQLKCHNIGVIGFTAILFRQNKNPSKRKIKP
ncbi:MAG: YhbY family RNA-binding protein [Candidatus Zophobacter franzmannii]|jgi:RNA-binding protein|nr:YhbY family RNA-binding protein [Candidatus Zophobacter franzmannii]